MQTCACMCYSTYLYPVPKQAIKHNLKSLKINAIKLAASIIVYQPTCSYLSEGWATSCNNAHSFIEMHPCVGLVPQYSVG